MPVAADWASDLKQIAVPDASAAAAPMADGLLLGSAKNCRHRPKELCWNLDDEADQAALCGFVSMTSIPSRNLAPAMSFGN